MSQQIENDLRQFVIENFLYGDRERKFSDDDSFLERGLIDSMGIVALIAHVQDTYKIAVSNEEVMPGNFDSVRRLAEFVRKKSSATGRSRGAGAC